MCKVKVAVCSETCRVPEHSMSTMQNCWMLNLVVRKETARLYMVNIYRFHWKPFLLNAFWCDGCLTTWNSVIHNFVRCAAQSGSYQHSSRLKQSLLSKRLGVSRNSVYILSNIRICEGIQLKSELPTQWNLNGCIVNLPALCVIAQQYSSDPIFSFLVFSIEGKPAHVLKMLLR